VNVLVVGDHWQTGAEVVLRVFDEDETHYYKPGPVAAQLHSREENVAEEIGAHLYDPSATDPPNRIGYTTSPDGYDHGCTVELERFACTVYPGEIERIYRKVMVRGGTGFSVCYSVEIEPALAYQGGANIARPGDIVIFFVDAPTH
jgi:hypothetical protein